MIHSRKVLRDLLSIRMADRQLFLKIVKAFFIRKHLATGSKVQNALNKSHLAKTTPCTDSAVIGRSTLGGSMVRNGNCS